MKRYLHVFLVLIISLLPTVGSPAQIFGGTLNYVYCGGSNYTINLGRNPGGLNNSFFFPFVSQVTDFKKQLFCSLLGLIIESNNVNIGRNRYYKGILSQEDLYIYKVFLRQDNGKEYNKTGDVTLLQ